MYQRAAAVDHQLELPSCYSKLETAAAVAADDGGTVAVAAAAVAVAVALVIAAGAGHS